MISRRSVCVRRLNRDGKLVFFPMLLLDGKTAIVKREMLYPQSLDDPNLTETIFVYMHFQVLARRLRFQLERAQGESSLIDRTGRTLKMEPLATVGDLERYLLKMVSLLWYTTKMS